MASDHQYNAIYLLDQTISFTVIVYHSGNQTEPNVSIDFYRDAHLVSWR